MTCTARRATLADVDALVGLMAEFYAESAHALDIAWADANFRRLLLDEALGCAWVVRDGAALAGHCVLTLRYSMEHGGLEGYVDDLFVRPAHRRKGAATAAMQALVAECVRRSALALTVEAGEGNTAANALYARFGLMPRDDHRVTRTVTLRR